MSAVNGAPTTRVAVTLGILRSEDDRWPNPLYEGYKAMFHPMNPYIRSMAAQIQHKQPPAAIMDIAPATLK